MTDYADYAPMNATLKARLDDAKVEKFKYLGLTVYFDGWYFYAETSSVAFECKKHAKEFIRVTQAQAAKIAEAG